MRRLQGLALFLGGVALAGCEGGRIDDVSTGAARGGALSDGGVLGPGGGIAATVDGASYHFAGDARYTAAGEGRHSLSVVSLNSDASGWNIVALTPEPGRYRCGEAGPSIRLERDGMGVLSSSGGDCELTVATANVDELQGAFRARLVDADGGVHVVEDGRFAIDLASAIPDLDGDGLSDADDNCPFTANADQADADANERGDACEPSDDERS